MRVTMKPLHTEKIGIMNNKKNQVRKAGDWSPLLKTDWKYVEKFNLDEFRGPDWALLNSQRAEYLAEQLPEQVLALLKASEDAPSFGYAINNYEHCVQTAVLLHQDNHDEETIVTGLLHDVGFVVCPENHGRFAADLLRPYISEKNVWMLEHHEIFQRIHLHEFSNESDPNWINERDRWRDHPFFEWTADFIEKYDIVAVNPNLAGTPIEIFEPMVQRVFSGA